MDRVLQVQAVHGVGERGADARDLFGGTAGRACAIASRLSPSIHSVTT